ncbi:MAG: hypothetical protein ACI4U0_06505 [Candidatus Aphodocola sp.]
MKKITTIILTLLITFFTCVLCFSFCVKDMIIDTLAKDVVKKEISSIVIDAIEKNHDNINYEVMNEIETNVGNSYEMTIITEKYLDGIVKSIMEDEEIIVPSTTDDIINLINENESVLAEAGVEITSLDKDKISDFLISDGRLDKVYKNVVRQMKNNLSNKEIMFVNVYDKITTNTFRWMVLSIIILIILIIALIKKSYYRWLYDLGVSFALSGIILALAIPLLSGFISKIISDKIIMASIKINFNPLINAGYLCFVLCALSIVIYLIGNKLTRYTNSKYDY